MEEKIIWWRKGKGKNARFIDPNKRQGGKRCPLALPEERKNVLAWRHVMARREGRDKRSAPDRRGKEKKERNRTRKRH